MAGQYRCAITEEKIMNTKQITAGTLAMFMGFAFAAPGAMAEETTEGTTTGNTKANDSSSNDSDPSGKPGNQGVDQPESEGNAGGDTHDGTSPPPVNVKDRLKEPKQESEG